MCGHTPQRFLISTKLVSSVITRASLYFLRRHDTGVVMYSVSDPTPALARLRAASRHVHGSADCWPTRRHDLLDWCRATASSKLARLSTLVSVCWPFSRFVIKDHCPLTTGKSGAIARTTKHTNTCPRAPLHNSSDLTLEEDRWSFARTSSLVMLLKAHVYSSGELARKGSSGMATGSGGMPKALSELSPEAPRQHHVDRETAIPGCSNSKVQRERDSN